MVSSFWSLLELIQNKRQGLQPCTLTYPPPLCHSHHLPSPLSHHPNLSPSLTFPPPFPTPFFYLTITTFPSSLSQNHYLPPLFPFLSFRYAQPCYVSLFSSPLYCAVLFMFRYALPCCVMLRYVYVLSRHAGVNVYVYVYVYACFVWLCYVCFDLYVSLKSFL
jgi:hypothetical protein